MTVVENWSIGKIKYLKQDYYVIIQCCCVQLKGHFVYETSAASVLDAR